jgi:hypothetical protein
MNLALAMFWSEQDFGLVIMTDIAGTAADEALRRLAAELYQAFSGKVAQGSRNHVDGRYAADCRIKTKRVIKPRAVHKSCENCGLQPAKSAVLERI